MDAQEVKGYVECENKGRPLERTSQRVTSSAFNRSISTRIITTVSRSNNLFPGERNHVSDAPGHPTTSHAPLLDKPMASPPDSTDALFISSDIVLFEPCTIVVPDSHFVLVDSEKAQDSPPVYQGWISMEALRKYSAVRWRI